MAPIWKGTLAFGLVTIPVELRPAVRASRIGFRLLHARDLSPVRYERVCTRDGGVVPWSDIVRGYEYARGKFVPITDDDFAAARATRSETVEIEAFVRREEIDARHFDTPYFLVPGKGGEKAYALLRDTMERRGVVGMGTIVLHDRQHLAAIGVAGRALTLELMRFADELLDPAALHLPGSAAVRPADRRMADELVRSLEAPFDAARWTDEQRARLQKVIRAKLKGKAVARPPAAASARGAKVLDLTERLRASLADRKSGAGTRKRRARPARGKPPAGRRRA